MIDKIDCYILALVILLAGICAMQNYVEDRTQLRNYAGNEINEVRDAK